MIICCTNNSVEEVIALFTMARGRKRTAPMTLSASDAADVAEKLKSKRTNQSTKLTYKSKLRTMIDWLSEHASECLNEDQSDIIIPVPNNVVLNFFGHICAKASQRDEDESTVQDGEAPLSVSSVVGYRSALVNLYRNQTKELDPSLNTELKVLLDGYQKVINGLKKRGVMKISEGKQHLKANGYTMLCEKLLTRIPEVSAQSWSMVVFSWSYFIVMWNLMSRSDSVDSIMLQHIDWEEDCLTIEEQGHKGDQTGSDKFGKHVYANPFEPLKCPVLAVAILLFCCPSRSENGNQQLFSGTNSKNRFGKMLRLLLNNLTDDEIQVLGCPAEDIGAHSLRKGSSTYALGQVNGPNPVSVFLRMGQSLGRLKDRYIHFGEGADQLCGRMITGLPFNDETFGVLPPHFKRTTLALMDSHFWSEIVPGFVNYPNGVKTAFPFLLASVIHHEAFLRATCNERHPIFAARVFSQNRLLDRLRGSTILGIGMSRETGMKATGIPPHLAIAAKLKDVMTEISDLRKEISDLKLNLTAELPQKIASKVSDELRENFTVDGVLPLSIRDIDSRMSSLRNDIFSELNRVTGQSREASDQVTLPSQTEQTRSWWKTWTWHDGHILHFAPPNWQFPVRMSVKCLWDLWHFGHVDTGIRPYKLLMQIDIIKPHRMRYSRAKSAMQCVDEVILSNGILPQDVRAISSIPLATSSCIFDQAFAVVLAKLYDGKIPRRSEDISYGRLYNLICALRKSAVT